MDVQLTWTDCDEAGDNVVPYVLSPRDLVSRPDNMDETVLHTKVILMSCHSLCFNAELAKISFNYLQITTLLMLLSSVEEVPDTSTIVPAHIGGAF